MSQGPERGEHPSAAAHRLSGLPHDADAKPNRPRQRHLPAIPRDEDYYPYLFIALVLLTIAYPVASFWPAGRAIEQIVLSAVLITGTLATYKRRWQIALMVAVLTTMVSSGIATEVRGGAIRWLTITFLSSITGFLSLVTWTLARDIFAQRARVTAKLLYGAASVYLLIGIAFATGHFLIETIAPGAYHCGSPQCEGSPRQSAYIYFSFITLATVGYGEIVPNSRIAGMLTYVEAIVGQMYVAILVARLVGMHIAHDRDE